jgi:hypothetical protein
VVTRDVGPYSIVAGVPARPIRERLPHQTYRLDGSGLYNSVCPGIRVAR